MARRQPHGLAMIRAGPQVHQGHRSDLHWLGVGAQWARLSVTVGVQVPRQRCSGAQSCHQRVWILLQVGIAPVSTMRSLDQPATSS